MAQNADNQLRILDYESSPPARPHRIRSSIMLAGYLMATFLALQLLEPGLTPPGFTGRGALAMVLPIFGAFHLATCIRSRIVFFAFGSISAMLLMPGYLDSHRDLGTASGRESVAAIAAGWLAFVLGVGLFTCLSAALGAYLARRATAHGSK